MAGIARSGFQALANAVWSLVALGSRTVTASGGSIASVSGAVGSVTGAVGSVTGAVGSVAGAVTGPVTGAVKSIQHGTISTGLNSTSGNSTIGSVDTSKSIIIPLGSDWSGSVSDEHYGRLFFTNSTTVSMIRNLNAAGGAAQGTFGYTVVEYYL